MAHFNLIWPILLISFFCFNIVSNLAEFPNFKHSTNKKGDSIAFLVVGDWGRVGNFNQSRVAAQMGEVGKKLGIDFVISVGDNFYDNGLKDENDPLFRRSFTNIYTAKSLQKPWFIGNHDYQGNTRAQLSQALKKVDNRWNCRRNFIVRAGIVDIVFIDTTPFVSKYFTKPKQNFDWKGILPIDEYLSAIRKNLDLELAKSRARWKIVVGHHTMRSIGYHGDTQEIVDQILPILQVNVIMKIIGGLGNLDTQEIVDQILPILQAHKVDMYINGHDHCLEHLSDEKSSIQFLTSGGGSKAWKNEIHYGMHNGSMHFYHDGQGFMSVQITRKKAKIAFYGVSGKPLHRLKLKH